MSSLRLALDLDGVIVDSDERKARAFAQLFVDLPTAVQAEVDAWNRSQRGVPRRKKFEYVTERWLGSSPAGLEALRKRLARQYEQSLRSALQEAVLLPGAESLASSGLPMHVCSSAPLAEVRAVLRRHGLAEAFVSTFGDPPGKTGALKLLVQQFPTDDIVMIGDGGADLDAARAAGVRFVGVERELGTFTGKGVVTVHNLREALLLLRSRD